MTAGGARITAVCITQALKPRTRSTRTETGIDKGPVSTVVVTPDGVEGDRVLDTAHHGGIDKAVYAYADEDAAWWAAELGTDIPAGRFGENLRTTGIDLTGAVIGERWRIAGGVEVEVSEPRTPCATFQHHMDDRSGWVRRFARAGRVGTYLRVIRGGPVTAGDRVVVLDRPDHGVTVGGWFSDPRREDAAALLAAEDEHWRMAAALRAMALDVLMRR